MSARGIMGLLAAASLLCCVAETSAQTPVTHAVPDFSGTWQRFDPPMMMFMPPPTGRGPVRVHPAHEKEVNDLGIYIGDPSDPLLKPWVAQALKEKAYRQIVDQEEVLPAHSLCWPSGVPGNLRLREPVQFLQTPEQITLLYQRDHQVRRIYMNVPHTANPPKTWYGESVGHYEGDVLVVDTIGLNDRTSVDWWLTPHSDEIHVIERYKITDDGRMLEVFFTVDDPKAFTEKWSAIVHYRRGAAPVEEIICAENNKNASTNEDYPVPMSAKADF